MPRRVNDSKNTDRRRRSTDSSTVPSRRTRQNNDSVKKTNSEQKSSNVKDIVENKSTQEKSYNTYTRSRSEREDKYSRKNEAPKEAKELSKEPETKKSPYSYDKKAKHTSTPSVVKSTFKISEKFKKKKTSLKNNKDVTNKPEIKEDTLDKSYSKDEYKRTALYDTKTPYKRSEKLTKKIEALSERKEVTKESDTKDNNSFKSYRRTTPYVAKAPYTEKESENKRTRSNAERITPPTRATSKSKADGDAINRHGKKNVDLVMKRNFIKLGVMVVIGIGVITGIYYGVQSIIAKQSGFTGIAKTEAPSVVSTQTPRERNTLQNAQAVVPAVTPNPAKARDISYGARDIEFKERQINKPGIYDNEIVFSAGTGGISLGGAVLTKLYLYNLDAGDETLITESTIKDFGEFYETYVNHHWLIWLETDHGDKNYIMCMNRSTGKISKLQSFKEGSPKLRLYDDLLVWMEHVSPTEDRLRMTDLNSQEPLTLFTFTDNATYGVSSPCVYKDTIVWSGPDKSQSDADKANGEKSTIYYQKLEADETGTFSAAKQFSPNTYVHEPLYNGDVFVWLDGNKSPNSNLFVARPDEEPRLIANGVTTYSVGDGIVVFGKDQAVWVYVTDTDELCRLTSPDEMGMLPSVTKRTVVWYNLSAESDKDVLRFKVLSDEELFPGGKN